MKACDWSAVYVVLTLVSCFLTSVNAFDSDSKSSSSHESDAESALKVTIVLGVFFAILILGICAAAYTMVSNYITCCPSEHHRPGSEFVRSNGAFRQDLLDDEEMMRLWTCGNCDFANYEQKTHCTLCGHERLNRATILPPAGFNSPKETDPNVLAGSYDTTATIESAFPSWRSMPQSPPPEQGPTSSPFFIPDADAGSASTPISILEHHEQSNRHEWRPALQADKSIVWSWHMPSFDVETKSSMLTPATAFVSRVHTSSHNPFGLMTVGPALQTPVYVPTRKDHPSALAIDSLAIESIRGLSFPQKHRWFMQETSSVLHSRWESTALSSAGRDFIRVDRNNIVGTTMNQISSLTKTQLQNPLRVRFANEPGIDAGGIVREWFDLAVMSFLDPTTGLFTPINTSDDGLRYDINPSACIGVQDHLPYYRAFGRLIGKALLEGQLVPVPLTDALYKHILSAPLSFSDVMASDHKLGHSLELLWSMPLAENDDEDDPYALDFSVYETAHGIVDLKPNGRHEAVTETNKREYIRLFVQWQLADKTRKEIAALVSGVYDVLPMHMLAPFDHQELRLLLSGTPVLDVSDWEKHTLVTGRKSRQSKLLRWFWRTLENMTQEQQSLILRFATGSGRVPVQGFKALTTSEGRLCPFTINCLPKSECEYLRAYTCFNRLDLPVYKSEKEVAEALDLLTQTDVCGFSIQ